MTEQLIELPEVLIITKKDKLDKLKINKQEYGTDSMNIKEPGELLGDYKGSSLIGTKRNVTPEYCDIRGKWCFLGDISDLKRIQAKLKLRDSDNHVITVTEETLVDPFDQFWGNTKLYTQIIMTEGRKVLTSGDPLNELLMRVYLDSLTTEKEGQKQSLSEIGDATFKITSPSSEAKAAVANVDRNLEASSLLFEMSPEKKRLILDILQPDGYSSSETNPDIIQKVAYTAFLNNQEMPLFGNRTMQQMCIELAKAEIKELSLRKNVNTAISKGIIRRDSTNGYTIKGQEIDKGSIKTDMSLYSFYGDPVNGMDYDNLLKLITL